MKENTSAASEDHASTDSADPFSEESIEQFAAWVKKEFHDSPCYKYGSAEVKDVLEKQIKVCCLWRHKFKSSKVQWLKMIKGGRMLKELQECAPIVATVLTYIDSYDSTNDGDGRISIIDLCSGFGYLGMFLSEILPPEKIQGILLVDKMFPRKNYVGEPDGKHLSIDHIGGIKWPIEIAWSKQDLKQKSCRKFMNGAYFTGREGPVLVLAVHLCGTLSLQAVNFFNMETSVTMIALKPCCLPGPVHKYRDEIWNLGGHEIVAKEVAQRGKWNKGEWVDGPPRETLTKQFNLWSNHLCEGIDCGEAGKKYEQTTQVQEKHFQNKFIYGFRDNMGKGDRKMKPLCSNWDEEAFKKKLLEQKMKKKKKICKHHYTGTCSKKNKCRWNHFGLTAEEFKRQLDAIADSVVAKAIGLQQ